VHDAVVQMAVVFDEIHYCGEWFTFEGFAGNMSVKPMLGPRDGNSMTHEKTLVKYSDL